MNGISYLRPYFVIVVLATITLFVLGAISSFTFSLVGPAITLLSTQPGNVKELADQIFGAQISSRLPLDLFSTSQVFANYLCGFILILALLRAILTQAHWYIWEYISEKISFGFREKLVQNFIYLSPSYKSAQGIEEKLSGVIGADLKIVKDYVVHFFGGVPRELVLSMFYLVTMILISPKLSGGFLLLIAPGGFALSRIGKKIRKRTSKSLDQTGELSEWTQQRLLGIETIKHLGTEGFEKSNFDVLNDSLWHALYRSVRAKSQTAPILQFVAVCGLAGVLGYSLVLVSRQQLTGSILISFLSTLAIFTQSIGKLGRYFNSNQEGRSALERILTVISDLQKGYEPELKIDSSEVKPNFAVTANSLGFSYDGVKSGASKMSVKDININFEFGKFYCVCGASGAGKSTLMKLILGLIKPSTGFIRFNEKIENRSDIAYIPQKLHFRQGSIADFVSYPLTDWDKTRIDAALKMVDLDPLIKSFKEGVETILPEGGGVISGGELQRLYFARALYHDSKILLIDEGTSALDPVLEKSILNLIKLALNHRFCVIMIAHRPAALDVADEVIVLDEGRVKLRGKSEQLSLNPEFQSLWAKN